MKWIATAASIALGLSVALWLGACSKPADGAPAGSNPRARTVKFYRDPMHPAYVSDRPGKAPDCGMDLEPVFADEGDVKTIALSGEQRAMLGVKVERVARARATGTLRALGRVVADENRVFPVRAGCDGFVTRIAPLAVTGKTVRKGERLATVYGRDYTTAQRSFLYALRGSENPPPTLPGDDANQPVLGLQEARLALLSLGIGEAQIESLAATRRVSLDIELTAPAAGVIVARNVSPRQRFEKDAELFRIADLRRVWIVAALLGDDQAAIHAGDTAEVSVPGAAGPELRATVSEALGRFDRGSRSLELRLTADNPALALKPDMPVDVQFAVSLGEATTVPSGAVVESALGKTVYVDRGDGTLEPRSVTIGWRFGGRVQILGGLKEGEPVVVSGNALLDAESRMRRGDAGVHD